MYIQENSIQKNRDQYVNQKWRSEKQGINFIDNRPAGILQRNIIPGETWKPIMYNTTSSRVNQVAQLARLKLTIMELGKRSWNNDKETAFQEYVTNNGWSYDKSRREIDTGESDHQTVQDLLSGFDTFYSRVVETQATSVKREDLKEKQRKDVESIMTLFKGLYYPNVELMTGLDGKRNAGIYEIQPTEDTPFPLIAKLTYKFERTEEADDVRMVRKFGQVQLLREHNPRPDQRWKLCVPATEYMYIGKGQDFTIYIVLYEKMPGKTLEKHIRDNTMPEVDMVAVGKKVANFHISAFSKTGKYLVHKDLNTSNIILDENGFMGLVDTDEADCVDDTDSVIYDVTTLLNMVRSSMSKYLPDTIKAKIKQFLSGYFEIMEGRHKDITRKIRAAYPAFL